MIETGTDKLLCSVEDHVATVVFNDPGKHNPIGGESRPHFRELISRLGRDASIRCVVITGAGTAFCSGGSTDSMKELEFPPFEERVAQIRWEHSVVADFMKCQN